MYTGRRDCPGGPRGAARRSHEAQAERLAGGAPGDSKPEAPPGRGRGGPPAGPGPGARATGTVTGRAALCDATGQHWQLESLRATSPVFFLHDARRTTLRLQL